MLRYQVHLDYRRIEAACYLREFVDVARFIGYCRTCPSYGRNWGCPEFDIDPHEVWQADPWLHLWLRVFEFDPGQSRTGFVPEVLVGEVEAMMHAEQRALQRLLLRRAAHLPAAIAVGAGSCRTCAECARASGEPCRVPDHLVRSIESLGGDVGATAAELFGRPLQWGDRTTLPPYYLQLGGVLCDLEELPGAASSIA